MAHRLRELWRRGGPAACRLRPLGIPAAYTAIALLLLWPLPLHFATRVPFGGDAPQYIWNLWWLRQATTPGVGLLYTNVLYHPIGVSLAFTTLVPLLSALTVPLQWAGLSLVACYNLLLLLSSVLGAWAMWALARRLTGSPAAAFVAGLVYGWSPYHSAHLMGHLNLASHQWLPLYVLALLRAVDGCWPAAEEEGWRACPEPPRPWRWAAVAALAAAATALTEWTYAAFLFLWTALYLLYRAWPLARRGAWRTLARAGGPLTLVVGLALLPALPLLAAMARELRGADYMRLTPAETLSYAVDAVAYLLPSELHPLAGAWVGRIEAFRLRNLIPSERVVTLGWTVPALGLAALLWRRERGVRFWGWSNAVFAVLSLGPILYIMGRSSWTAFETRVLLPYALLYDLPGFSVMRTPGRFAVLVSLGGAVLAAHGLVALRRRWPRAGRLLPALAAALIVAEYWAPPQLAALGRQDYTAALRADPAPGAVLNVPTAPLVEYLWYQTQHERPIVGGHLSRQPPDQFAAENPALRYLRSTTPPEETDAVRDGAGLRSLRQAGIRYLVVHWWATGQDTAAVALKLAVLLGDDYPVVESPGDQASFYLIGP